MKGGETMNNTKRHEYVCDCGPGGRQMPMHVVFSSCEPGRTSRYNSCATDTDPCTDQKHHPVSCGCQQSDCGCLPRHFISSAEVRQKLEDYQQQLENELAGVSERIQKLEEK